MKRLRSLVLGLFALCSMVGMAQEAKADDTGYYCESGAGGSRFYRYADRRQDRYAFRFPWQGGYVAVYSKLVWCMP